MLKPESIQWLEGLCDLSRGRSRRCRGFHEREGWRDRQRALCVVSAAKARTGLSRARVIPCRSGAEQSPSAKRRRQPAPKRFLGVSGKRGGRGRECGGSRTERETLLGTEPVRLSQRPPAYVSLQPRPHRCRITSSRRSWHGRSSLPVSGPGQPCCHSRRVARYPSRRLGNPPTCAGRTDE